MVGVLVGKVKKGVQVRIGKKVGGGGGGVDGRRGRWGEKYRERDRGVR